MSTHDLSRARQLVINELISEVASVENNPASVVAEGKRETLTNTVCSDIEREKIRKDPRIALYTGKCWTVGLYMKNRYKIFGFVQRTVPKRSEDFDDFTTCTQDLTNIMNESVPILAFLQWYFQEPINEHPEQYSIDDLVWCSQMISCFPNVSPSVCLLKSQLIDEIREHLIVKRERAQAHSSIIGIVILLSICSVVIWICAL
jgi:hypothetical protein